MALTASASAAKDKKQADTAPAIVAPRTPGQLDPDTTIKLLTVGQYKSGDSKKGDRVNLRVDEDIIDSAGNVLVRRGTAAFGTVTASRRSGIFGKRGLLDISIDYTHAVDGQKVPLRATKSRGGKSNAGASIAATILIAPVALFIKGSNVTLKEATPILAYVDDTIRVAAGDSPAASPKPSGPLKVVILRNGDQFTGQLEGLSGGYYSLITSGGSLKLKEADVKEIRDAEPATREGDGSK